MEGEIDGQVDSQTDRQAQKTTDRQQMEGDLVKNYLNIANFTCVHFPLRNFGKVGKFRLTALPVRLHGR